MTDTYLGNFVWDDLNGNGIQDSGEPGIGGVVVNLLNQSGHVVRTTTTSSTGAYSFKIHTPKPTAYGVQVVAPSGYSFTSRNSGAVDKDSDVDPLTGRTGSYLLTYYPFSSSKNRYFDVDAGLYRKVTIGDRVFLDSNANGIQDTGELGLGGVTVQLLNSSHVVVDTKQTDANGLYSFSAAPGTYSVRVIAPNAYAFSPADQGGNDLTDSDVNASGLSASLTLRSGQSNTTLDAGLYQNVTIGDRVFVDSNANGIQDAGELGLVGVTVQLLNSSNAIVDTKQTDANGLYSFSARPGTYSVKVIAPNNYVFSPLDRGNNDAIDSDVNTGGVSAAFTLTSGQVRDIDAGLLQPQPILKAELLRDSTDENGVLINPDGSADWYIVPNAAGTGTFNRTIKITNTDTTFATTGPISFKINDDSRFVKLTGISSIKINGSTTVGFSTSYDVVTDTYTVTLDAGVKLNAGDYLTVKAASTLTSSDPTSTFQSQAFSFTTQDVPGTSDLGTQNFGGNLFFDEGSFDKTAPTLASFRAPGQSTLTVDLLGSQDIDATPTALNASTTIANGYVKSITPGLNDGVVESHEIVFHNPFDLDVDLATIPRRPSGGSYSTPQAASVSVSWIYSSGINLSGYTTASTDAAAYQALLDIIQQGAGSSTLNASSTGKGTNGLTVGGVNQTLTNASLVNVNTPTVITKTFIYDAPGANFQAFVNSLVQTGSAGKYRIVFESKNPQHPSYLDDVHFSSYDPNNSRGVVIERIVLPSNAQTLKIDNDFSIENINLSRTYISKADGSPAQVIIEGRNSNASSNKTDFIAGSLVSPDKIQGGNGTDIFFFGVNAGNDIVTDFKANGNGNRDMLNLTTLGITRNNVLATLDATSSGGNGNGVIDAGDRYVSRVQVGSTSALKLDLSYFSDRTALGIPNPGSPFMTTTTVTLLGVSQLSTSSFTV